jgi:hypothetical protein
MKSSSGLQLETQHPAFELFPHRLGLNAFVLFVWAMLAVLVLAAFTLFVFATLTLLLLLLGAFSLSSRAFAFL